MDLGNGLGHLTYSTLVHPGDTWDEMWNSLITYVPQVKARVSPDRAFGVSLRLSAASAQTLVDDDAARSRLKEFLAENDLYLYTVNAFPYGPFKGRVVKEQVYEPDWRSEERTQYTINVADVLADVSPEGSSPSIQTAPLGFKPRRDGFHGRRELHRARPPSRGPLRRARGADRSNCHARNRAGALLLPGDHGRDRRVLHQPSLLWRGRATACRACSNPGLRGPRCTTTPPRHRLRHLPPGARVRGHSRLAREAR